MVLSGEGIVEIGDRPPQPVGPGDVVAQHLLKALQAGVGIAVYEVYAPRQPEVYVLDEAGEYLFLASEVAIYRALAHAHSARQAANGERLHPVFGYREAGGVYDFAPSHAGGAAHPYDHFRQIRSEKS